MITEDYVGFETAKLLKEKGFDGKCDYLYVDGKLVRALGGACNWNDGETLFADYKNECSAPTLQMVMKWLREVHKIVINIGWGEVFEENYQWWCIILNQNSGEILRENKYHKTYEEACEAAIKYCLENLI